MDTTATPSPTLFVGPPAQATVYLMLTRGCIVVPPVLSDSNTLIADLCQRNKIDFDFKTYLTNLVNVTLPLTEPRLSTISDKVGSRVSQNMVDMIFVDLTSYDVDINLFHRLLNSIHQDAPIKLTIDEYWNMRSLLNDHLKYAQLGDIDDNFSNTLVSIIASGCNEKIEMYIDLIASNSHKLNINLLIKFIHNIGCDIFFQSNYLTVTEDKLVEIMKEYIKNTKDLGLPPVDEREIFGYVRLELLSNKALTDPVLQFRPDMYLTLCERTVSGVQTVTKSRHMSALNIYENKNFLIVRENTEEIVNINDITYTKLLNVYPDAKQCAQVIKKYINIHKSFEMKFSSNHDFIGVSSNKYIQYRNNTCHFARSPQSKMTVRLEKYNDNEFRLNDKHVPLCIYVRLN